MGSLKSYYILDKLFFLLKALVYKKTDTFHWRFSMSGDNPRLSCVLRQGNNVKALLRVTSGQQQGVWAESRLLPRDHKLPFSSFYVYFQAIPVIFTPLPTFYSPFPFFLLFLWTLKEWSLTETQSYELFWEETQWKPTLLIAPVSIRVTWNAFPFLIIAFLL